MRHSDYRGLEKNAQTYDDEYEGYSARSVDDHYNYPFSPNSSGEFMTDSSERQQQHSLSAFVQPKPKNKKDKKSKDTSTVNKLVEEPSNIKEKTPQNRGRLTSRDYYDTQFDMEPEDDLKKASNASKCL